MKKISLYFIAFLAFSTSFAQTFEIGLRAGTTFNTMPSVRGKNYDANRERLPVATLEAIRNKGPWQYGLSVAYGQNSFKFLRNDGFGFNPYYYVAVTNKNVPVSLFISRKISLYQFEPYCGIAAGITFANTRSENNADNYSYRAYTTSSDYYWLTAGIKSGCTYLVTKHLGIKAEVDALYNNHIDGMPKYYSTFSFPVTAGIIFKL